VTLTLHLGVLDVPYGPDAPTVRSVAKARPAQHPKKARATKKGGGSKTPNETTGDVATLLEDKYHLMEVWYENNELAVADAFADAMAGELEDMMTGAPPKPDLLAPAMGFIEEGFKAAISEEAFAGYGVPGVPTKAARQGTTPRKKSGKGARRASFRYSGLYQASMKAWVTGN